MMRRLQVAPSYIVVESNARVCEVYTQAVGEAEVSYVGTVRQSQGGDVLPGCHSIEVGLQGVLNDTTGARPHQTQHVRREASW